MRYLASTITLRLDESRCNGCRRCVEVCPHAVFSVAARRARIARLDACMECGACMRNCPESALTVRAGVGCAYSVLTRTAVPRPACGGGPSGARPIGSPARTSTGSRA